MSEIYYGLFHMHTARISNGDSVMFNKRDDRFFELDKEIEKDVFYSSCHERGTLILFTRKIFIISSTLCDLFNLAIRVFHSSLSQPPSNSNKKKQKELKDPKMPKQIPPRRRVVVDSDEEMGPKSARNGDSQAVRVSLSLSLSLSSRILTDIIALFSTSGLGVNIN